MKLFNHYSILIEVTGDIRATVKTKLWRMGKLYSSYGGAKRKQQLLKWPSTSWKFEVSEVKVNHQLINRKRKLESQLEEENSKRRRLESELKNLKKKYKGTGNSYCSTENWTIGEKQRIFITTME